MAATIEFMYAHGPLIDSFGEFVHHAPATVSAPTEGPAPLTAPIVVRCVDRDGRDLATPITVRPDQPFATAALRLVVRDRDQGSCSADRFGHVVFNALQDLDERQLTARNRAIQKRLRALDHLAIVGFDHDGTITWDADDGRT